MPLAPLLEQVAASMLTRSDLNDSDNASQFFGSQNLSYARERNESTASRVLLDVASASQSGIIPPVVLVRAEAVAGSDGFRGMLIPAGLGQPTSKGNMSDGHGGTLPRCRADPRELRRDLLAVGSRAGARSSHWPRLPTSLLLSSSTSLTRCMPRGVTIDVGGTACWVLAYTESTVLCVLDLAPSGGRFLQVDLRWAGYGYAEAGDVSRPGQGLFHAGQAISSSWQVDNLTDTSLDVMVPLSDEYIAPVEVHGITPVIDADVDLALASPVNIQRVQAAESLIAAFRDRNGTEERPVWTTASTQGG